MKIHSEFTFELEDYVDETGSIDKLEEEAEAPSPVDDDANHSMAVEDSAVEYPVQTLEPEV